MDPYEIKVIATISGVVIALCVFTLVMELLRMRPGTLWLSPPLLSTSPADTEKGEPEGAGVADVTTVITPILKPDYTTTPDLFARQKRVQSASAVRFYAYNRSRSNSEQAMEIGRDLSNALGIYSQPKVPAA